MTEVVTIRVPTDTVVVQTSETDVVQVATDVIESVVEVGVAGPQGIAGEDGEDGDQGPQGDQGPPGSNFTYTHTQAVASAFWTIAHGLGGFPNVTVVDSGGTEVEGAVDYVDANTLTIAFSAAFAGSAYLS